MVQPEPGRRSPEEMEVCSEQAPGVTFVRPGLHAVRRNTKAIKIDALTVEHPVEIMVRRKEQARRIFEGRIGGKPLRVRVSMRAYDRQILDLRIKAPGNLPRARRVREEPVWV